MSDINKKHDDAVRETRRKIANAVQERAEEQVKTSTGWKRIVWAIVLGAATLAGWYFSPGASQNQPEPTEPPAAEQHTTAESENDE